MSSIYLLNKQLNIINNILSDDDISNILLIRDAMKHLSKLGENYFDSPMFTDNNRFLRFIKDLLEYNTKLVIGCGIEMIIRRMLFNFFNATSFDDFNIINNRIDTILTTPYGAMTLTLLDDLYKVVCPLLVKNSVELFANRHEKLSEISRPSKEILEDYFDKLSKSPYMTEDINNKFKKVITYFDTFIDRTIKLWRVNIENILRFYINNHRCLETFINLIS